MTQGDRAAVVNQLSGDSVWFTETLQLFGISLQLADVIGLSHEPHR